MPLTEHYAKSLLRELEGRTELILEQPKHWDLTFLRVYLDHCDKVLFDDPRTGLELAEMAPRLASLIPERNPHEWRFTRAAELRLHRELTARSHGTLGGAYRAGGRFKKAEQAYSAAFRVCDSGAVSSLIRANLCKRFAKLRSAQKRYSEAMDLVDFTIEVYEDRDQDYFADALLTKGYILGESHRGSEAIPYFGRVLSLTRPTRGSSRFSKRVFDCAAQNLASASSEGCHSQDLRKGLYYVKLVKKSYARKPRSINKHRLEWIEGRILARLGSTRVAERRFLRAFKQFSMLGAPIEAGLVSLDLGLIYQQHGEWDKLEELAAETFERFHQLSSNQEAFAALRLCMEAAAAGEQFRANLVSVRKRFEKLAFQR